jgi:transcriptional regulator GlxA family with amidase domain
MPSAKLVALVAYPGAQILDLAGPAAVFSAANRARGYEAYDVRIVSSCGGAIRTGGGLTVGTTQFSRVPARRVHTLLVAGGEDDAVIAVLQDARTRAWVTRAAEKSARFGSVCSGTFVLAACGLLDGKRVATHWAACERLAQLFPALTVDSDALYVEDGRAWTSAGVTTGIDMALALVERDLGAQVANSVAQRLVLYARRPGFQSQWSPLLRAQREADSPYAGLIAWIEEHLSERLDVPLLAGRAGQSVRGFYRRFVATTGQTPAHFVEALRLDRVRALLERPLTLKEIARATGFSDPARMTRAFERRFGVKPSMFRDMGLRGPTAA